MSSPRPEPTIHERFGRALLQVALEGAGQVHLDVPVESEPMDIEAWELRRSANDREPPHAESSDPRRRLQQGILGAAMGAAGMVPVTVHVDALTDFLGLYFEPDPDGTPAPGLLGRMTRAPSILSLHHAPPDEDAIHEAMRKALNLWTNQGRAAKKAHRKRPEMPGSWLLGTAHAPEMMEGFGFQTKRGWPAGFRFAPPIFAMAAVSLGDLALTRDTLLLRLLGTGDMLESALAEQAELPPDALERRATRAALLAVAPRGGEAVSIGEPVKDPVLRACRKIYRQWARKVG